MHSPDKTMKVRLYYALRAEQDEAWNAAYDALEGVLVKDSIEDLDWTPRHDFDEWPVSGDDLALAKAGRTAWPTTAWPTS